MKPLILIQTGIVLAAAWSAGALAQTAASPASPPTVVAAPAPMAASAPAIRQHATTIYRQVLPDGRIVYSDEAVSGARVDHTIKVAPPIEGNLWTTEPGARAVVPPQTVPTPIRRIAIAPARTGKTGAVTVSDEVLAEVMRAEMLLEDAKKRQAEGVAPLSVEVRDNSDGGPATNQAYMSRQKRLARDVAYAEEELRKAKERRDGGR